MQFLKNQAKDKVHCFQYLKGTSLFPVLKYRKDTLLAKALRLGIASPGNKDIIFLSHTNTENLHTNVSGLWYISSVHLIVTQELQRTKIGECKSSNSKM